MDCKPLFPISIICLLLFSANVADAQGDEQKIMDFFAAIEAAYAAEDIDGFENLVSASYFNECRNRTVFMDEIRYDFDNYYDLQVNFEIISMTITGDIAVVGTSGNWSGIRNSDGVLEWNMWGYEEDILRKENDEWKWYGNQLRSNVHASVGHNCNKWDDHYFLFMFAESECDDRYIAGVNVTGPGIGVLPLEIDDEGRFLGFGNLMPAIGDEYSFHVVYDDSYAEDINHTIMSYVESGPNITYPGHYEVIDELYPVFEWDPPASGIEDLTYYWIRVYDTNGSEIWDIYLQINESSVKYDVDGTAMEPLMRGRGYIFDVFVFDVYNSYAYQFYYFETSPDATDNYVYVEPYSTRSALNRNFTVNVEIDTIDEVYAGQFYLLFNSSVIEALGVDEGGFFRQDGAGTSFPAGVSIDNGAGMVTFANTRLMVPDGVAGQGVLASILFTAKQTGSTDLFLSDVIFSDTAVQEVPFWILDGVVEVITLEGDVNGDCAVNIYDLAAVGLAYGSQPGDHNWEPGADLTGDGKVNIFDLATVGLNYGKTC